MRTGAAGGASHTGVADVALSVMTPVSNLVFDPPIDVSGGRSLSLNERRVYSN